MELKASEINSGDMIVTGNLARIVEEVTHGPLDNSVRFLFEGGSTLTVDENERLVTFPAI